MKSLILVTLFDTPHFQSQVFNIFVPSRPKKANEIIRCLGNIVIKMTNMLSIVLLKVGSKSCVSPLPLSGQCVLEAKCT